LTGRPGQAQDVLFAAAVGPPDPSTPPEIAPLALWNLPTGDILTLVFTILWLIVLEGLLSGDNALVLAVMVRHLPRKQQRKALTYGIYGAFFFRFVAVLISAYLIQFWYIEVLGGLYLCFLAAKHFLTSEPEGHQDAEGQVRGKGFWATVIQVELTDIVFSIDSILAAVAVANGLPPHLQTIQIGPFEARFWVVFLGGVLGIIAMRFVAGAFIRLLRTFPGLVVVAYALVAWIGLNLINSGLHKQFEWWPEVPPIVFWGGMGLIVIAGFLMKRNPDAKTSEEEKLWDEMNAPDAPEDSPPPQPPEAGPPSKPPGDSPPRVAE
jgi:YkoY family integral membrane protein